MRPAYSKSSQSLTNSASLIKLSDAQSAVIAMFKKTKYYKDNAVSYTSRSQYTRHINSQFTLLPRLIFGLDIVQDEENPSVLSICYFQQDKNNPQLLNLQVSAAGRFNVVRRDLKHLAQIKALYPDFLATMRAIELEAMEVDTPRLRESKLLKQKSLSCT